MSSFVLTKSLEWEQGADEVGLTAARVLDQTCAMAEVLAVDLLVVPRFRDEPILEESVQLARPTWHVRRNDLTADQSVRTWRHGAGHQQRLVPEISADTIGQVLAEALDQDAPPQRTPTFAHLEAKNLRARLLDDELMSSATLPVSRGRFAQEVPIVRDSRGAWVEPSYPVLECPLELTIANNDGAVCVKLLNAWSLWDEEGSPEHAALVDFARTLIAEGYDLLYVGTQFRDWLPPPLPRRRRT